MRVYSVHRRAWSSEEDGDAVFVKEGFCWPGLLFGLLWTLWHGMWTASAALFAIGLVGGGVIEAAGFNPALASVLQIFLQLGVGVFGNDMRRWSLRRAGYIESAVVAAHRRTAAEYRYFAAQP